MHWSRTSIALAVAASCLLTAAPAAATADGGQRLHKRACGEQGGSWSNDRGVKRCEVVALETVVGAEERTTGGWMMGGGGRGSWARQYTGIWRRDLTYAVTTTWTQQGRTVSVPTTTRTLASSAFVEVGCLERVVTSVVGPGAGTSDITTPVAVDWCRRHGGLYPGV